MKGRNASAAVVQNKVAVSEADTPERALQRRLNFFPTPPWAARAGADHLQAMFPDAETVLEPACGMGHIAGPAAEFFPQVLASDVHDWGGGFPVRDWLSDDWEEPACDLLYTNPPFDLAEEFVLRGLRRSRLGVALLLRIAFLEGGERHAILAGDKARLTQVVIFSERVSMVMGRWDPKSGLATAYGLFVWSKVHEPQPPTWFPPGTRDRLWRRDDPAVYGFKPPISLFPEL